MITINQIAPKLRFTSREDIPNIKYSYVRNWERSETDYFVEVLTNIPANKNYPKGHVAKHLVNIHALDGYKFTVTYYDTPVTFNCDCERFMYKWEYALTTHGASEILMSNGEPARITNPNNEIGLCKHCIIAMDFLVRNLGDYYEQLTGRKIY